MKRRNWTSKEKFKIVLEGIKGKVPLGELCSQYGISQAQYYKWRDRFLDKGEIIFEYGGPKREEEKLRKENEKLKAIIGELIIELKKNDF